MSEIVFTDGLLSQLMDAKIALTAYIQRRRAQGSISVSENDALRDSFFALARDIRGHGEVLHDFAEHDTCIAIHHAEEALSAAALCLMSGRYDCPSYIAVNVEKLERSLDVLNYCIRSLNTCAPRTQA
ncbi:biofilm formation regulator BssR [Vagococcus sp. WN89Y]|uniref:biofilm formation regulator BssR n=1 Tax=Vagococcus sp. WN89Y TaxID=3457258 RepID=UPI003FCD80AC